VDNNHGDSKSPKDRVGVVPFQMAFLMAYKWWLLTYDPPSGSRGHHLKHWQFLLDDDKPLSKKMVKLVKKPMKKWWPRFSRVFSLQLRL